MSQMWEEARLWFLEHVHQIQKGRFTAGSGGMCLMSWCLFMAFPVLAVSTSSRRLSSVLRVAGRLNGPFCARRDLLVASLLTSMGAGGACSYPTS